MQIIFKNAPKFRNVLFLFLLKVKKFQYKSFSPILDKNLKIKGVNC